MSTIVKREPLFSEIFYGWKFGPVLKGIRNTYRDNMFMPMIPEDVVERVKPVMDKVFDEYRFLTILFILFDENG